MKRSMKAFSSVHTLFLAHDEVYHTLLNWVECPCHKYEIGCWCLQQRMCSHSVYNRQRTAKRTLNEVGKPCKLPRYKVRITMWLALARSGVWIPTCLELSPYSKKMRYIWNSFSRYAWLPQFSAAYEPYCQWESLQYDTQEKLCKAHAHLTYITYLSWNAVQPDNRNVERETGLGGFSSLWSV